MIHNIVPLHDHLKPLLTRVYKDSIFFRDQRKHYARDGELNAWALDMRRALSTTRLLAPVADALIEELEQQQVTQVAGRGYGSFFLVGAIVARKPNMRAALIRESPKAHGFRELVEGDLRPHLRTAIIDDLVCSGDSLKSTVKVLQQKRIKLWGSLSVLQFGGPPIAGLPRQFEMVSLGKLYYK